SGDADGHQSRPRVLRCGRRGAGAGRRRRFAVDAVLSGLSAGRPGLRADGVRRRSVGDARQRHRRAGREPDDGGGGVPRHSIHRRRFRTDRGVRHAAAHARGAAERTVRRMDAVMPKLVRQGRFWVGALAAVMLALPVVVPSPFVIDIFIRVLLFAFIGVAWNLMGGYAKQLSLGHAAYFGLGAYTSTILQIRYGVSPWLGMLAGGGVAMLASLPIGALCFRLRGPYFAIATIATAQVLMLLFLKFRDFAWGAEGTTIPNLGNAPLMMQFDAKAAYYYIALA